MRIRLVKTAAGSTPLWMLSVFCFYCSSIFGEKSIEKPLIHYESAVYYLRVVEVTAVRPIPAETCKRLHAVPASYFFFAKLRSFGAKSVKIAYLKIL